MSMALDGSWDSDLEALWARVWTMIVDVMASDLYDKPNHVHPNGMDADDATGR